MSPHPGPPEQQDILQMVRCSRRGCRRRRRRIAGRRLHCRVRRRTRIVGRRIRWGDRRRGHLQPLQRRLESGFHRIPVSKAKGQWMPMHMHMFFQDMTSRPRTVHHPFHVHYALKNQRGGITNISDNPDMSCNRRLGGVTHHPPRAFHGQGVRDGPSLPLCALPTPFPAFV